MKLIFLVAVSTTFASVCMSGHAADKQAGATKSKIAEKWAQLPSCAKGAIAGGATGHVLGGHAILGAIAGCGTAQYIAVKKEAEAKATKDAQDVKAAKEAKDAKEAREAREAREVKAATTSPGAAAGQEPTTPTVDEDL